MESVHRPNASGEAAGGQALGIQRARQSRTLPRWNLHPLALSGQYIRQQDESSSEGKHRWWVGDNWAWEAARGGRVWSWQHRWGGWRVTAGQCGQGRKEKGCREAPGGGTPEGQLDFRWQPSRVMENAQMWPCLDSEPRLPRTGQLQTSPCVQ